MSLTSLKALQSFSWAGSGMTCDYFVNDKSQFLGKNVIFNPADDTKTHSF